MLDPTVISEHLDKVTGDINPEKLYTLSRRLAHEEILDQLKQAEPNTLTIIVLGPMTNLALAYREDPITLARCKQVICMGGCFDMPG